MLKKLTSINRYVMYLLLIVFATVPLFIKGLVIPTVTTENTEDFFLALNAIPKGSTVYLESDWTVSVMDSIKYGKERPFIFICKEWKCNRTV